MTTIQKIENQTEVLEEVDYYESPTKLFKCIENQAWNESVLRRLERNPSEAKIWVVKKTYDNVVIWRHLPIHEACIRSCPEAIITALIKAHPKGVREPDLNQRLPIHHAFENHASLEVITLLLLAYPDSLKMKDGSGNTPVKYLSELDDHTVSNQIFTGVASTHENITNENEKTKSIVAILLEELSTTSLRLVNSLEQKNLLLKTNSSLKQQISDLATEKELIASDLLTEKKNIEEYTQTLRQLQLKQNELEQIKCRYEGLFGNSVPEVRTLTDAVATKDTQSDELRDSNSRDDSVSIFQASCDPLQNEKADSIDGYISVNEENDFLLSENTELKINNHIAKELITSLEKMILLLYQFLSTNKTEYFPSFGDKLVGKSQSSEDEKTFVSDDDDGFKVDLEMMSRFLNVCARLKMDAAPLPVQSARALENTKAQVMCEAMKAERLKSLLEELTFSKDNHQPSPDRKSLKDSLRRLCHNGKSLTNLSA